MKTDQNTRIKLVPEADWIVIMENLKRCQEKIKSLEEEKDQLQNNYRLELISYHLNL